MILRKFNSRRRSNGRTLLPRRKLETIAQAAPVEARPLQLVPRFRQKVFAEGALNVKTKELIALATAHITQCPFCIDVHAKKAKTAGASEAEIAEAIFVAMAMRASASFTHAAIAMGALDEQPKP
ncbi:MAG: carboxymuconolactone decarboxylase family protein [Candidatus Binatia bacterium]